MNDEFLKITKKMKPILEINVNINERVRKGKSLPK
jgi:hypothetical protein